MQPSHWEPGLNYSYLQHVSFWDIHFFYTVCECTVNTCFYLTCLSPFCSFFCSVKDTSRIWSVFSFRMMWITMVSKKWGESHHRFHLCLPPGAGRSVGTASWTLQWERFREFMTWLMPTTYSHYPPTLMYGVTLLMLVSVAEPQVIRKETVCCKKVGTVSCFR